MTYEKNYQYIKKLLENRKYFLQMIDFIVENKEDRKIYKSKIEKVFGNKKRNVLIIGNGPSVKKMKIGKFIDQGDFFIIRINNYEISRFEEYIGTLTSLWVCCLGITQKPREMKNIKTLTCQNCLFNQEYSVKERLNAKIIDYKNIKTDIFHITNLFKFFYVRDRGIKYTTGLIILLLCSMYFQNNVFCYGFDFYQNGDEYYYGKTSKNLAHDFLMESKIFKLLVENNWIKPLDEEENLNLFYNAVFKNLNNKNKIKNKILDKVDKLESSDQIDSDQNEDVGNINLDQNKKSEESKKSEENMEKFTEFKIDHIVNIEKDTNVKII